MFSDFNKEQCLQPLKAASVYSECWFRNFALINPKRRTEMNIVELLKEDHREAEELIERLEGLEADLDDTEVGIDKMPQSLFTKLKNALTLHTQAEEQILYPAMQQFNETADRIPEAIEEHQQVDQILDEMAMLAPAEDEFQERLEELKENLAHHIEEEEDELFPMAEKLCGQKQLEEMGRQMQQLKQGRSAAAAAKRK
jgi:iron-sulfur cluster repair protein YtfE (RIC family)